MVKEAAAKRYVTLAMIIRNRTLAPVEGPAYLGASLQANYKTITRQLKDNYKTTSRQYTFYYALAQSA